MKVIDEAKTPSGVKLELVDWSDELPAMHKKERHHLREAEH